MKTFILQATGAKAKVWGPNLQGFWYWQASHSDGSGTKQNWCPTKRGAMICAINEYRWKAQNYKPMKFKWAEHPTPAQGKEG